MTMAQSNSMGAKSDLLFQLFWCHRLWMCAFCPSRLPLWFSLTMLFSFSLVFFVCCLFLLSRVFRSSLLVCVFLPLLSSAVLSLSFLFFHDLSLSLGSQLSLLSASLCLNQFSPTVCHYCLPLDLVLFFLPLQLPVSLRRSVPPSMCVPLCICMILEVWDSWTSLNFKASDDGGNIKVKW